MKEITPQAAATMMPASARLFLIPARRDKMKPMTLQTSPTYHVQGMIAVIRPTMPSTRPGSEPAWGADW